MDFGWSDKQHTLIAELGEATEGWEPPADGFFTRERWRECGELGLLGLCVPEELGGHGYDALTTAALVEEFGRRCTDTGLVFAASAHLFACVMPIVEHGSAALRERLVPRLCSGEWIGANAITEPRAGSDVTALETTAEREDGHYVLNGWKSFVSNGPVADVVVSYALTDPEFRHLGISGFALTSDAPGLTVGPPFPKMGLASCPAGTIEFRDCRLPAGCLLGGEGQGAAIFQSSMRWERACLFAGYLGLMARLLEWAVEHVRTRRQFGAPLSANQAVSHGIAEMKLRLESSRLLLYKACWAMDHGEPAETDIALAKLAVGENVAWLADEVLRLFGGAGYQCEHGIERALRDALPARVFSGTSEIQRELIGRELGL